MLQRNIAKKGLRNGTRIQSRNNARIEATNEGTITIKARNNARDGARNESQICELISER